MDTFQITFPKEEDWDWIIAQHAATAWASLPPAKQREVNLHTVQARLAGQVKEFRAGHGVSNQVFIVSVDDQPAGYVWVGQNLRTFTGETQAHILNLFVNEAFRGQGIGARLMELAESWAKEHRLRGIGLSVAAHNSRAIGLYEKMGYEREMLRMAKKL